MKNSITIEALELIDIIDKKGSFVAAAKALYKVPSAISYTVNKIEQDLGISLFVKKGRNVTMTPAARILLDHGREILRAVNQLEKTVIAADSGWEPKLNIAIDSILSLDFIFPLLKKFYELHPQIEINLYEEVLSGAWEAVTQSRADLVIGASNKPIENKEISFKHMQTINWIFSVSPNHPLIQAELPLNMKDIEAFRFIVVRDSVRDLSPSSARLFSKLPILSVPTLRDKIVALSNGLGVGFLPHIKAEQLMQAGKIVHLPINFKVEKSDLFIAWKTTNRGKSLRWFISELLDQASIEGLFNS